MSSLRIAEYMKIISKIVKMIAVIFLLYTLFHITYMIYYGGFTGFKNNFIPIFSNIILLVIVAFISDKIEEHSIAIEDDIETKLIGYIEGARNTSVDILARHLNIPSNKIMDLIAKVKAKGKLIDYTIDLSNGNIRYEERYSIEGTRLYATTDQEPTTKVKKEEK
jgi:uncharacterized membrane protein (DUF373 family)